MKKNDLYLHCKGNFYTFQCIALPKVDPTIFVHLHGKMNYVEDVRFHENTHDIALFEYEGIYFVESNIPHVIYVSVEHGMKWARPVDDFFGYKLEKGEWVQRFKKVNSDELEQDESMEVANNDNFIGGVDIQFVIEQSKQISNAKPTDNSSAIYPGRKPMI